MSPAPADPPPGTPKPFRQLGEQLGFADDLRAQGQWPLKGPTINRDVPTATPYLVIPLQTDDVGVRPLPRMAQPRFAGIECLDPAGPSRHNWLWACHTGCVFPSSISARLRRTLGSATSTSWRTMSRPIARSAAITPLACREVPVFQSGRARTCMSSPLTRGRLRPKVWLQKRVCLCTPTIFCSTGSLRRSTGWQTGTWVSSLAWENNKSGAYRK